MHKIDLKAIISLNLCLIIILIVGSTHSFSQIWGRVTPNAVTIYDIDLQLNREVVKELEDENSKDAYVDVLFPKLGTTNQYIITTMLVLDSRTNALENQKSSAFILSGGIGLNYTRVRFQVHDSEMNFNFVIYGIHPEHYI